MVSFPLALKDHGPCLSLSDIPASSSMLVKPLFVLFALFLWILGTSLVWPSLSSLIRSDYLLEFNNLYNFSGIHPM